MPIFPINRRVPILFGKIFSRFDSFITQDPENEGMLEILLALELREFLHSQGHSETI
jgi:hypothetical protein